MRSWEFYGKLKVALGRNAIYLHNGYDRAARDSFYEKSIRAILIANRSNEQAWIRCKREW